MAFVPFSHKLVLNRYMLGLFGVETLDLDQDPFVALAQHLKDEIFEGMGQDGLSLYYEILERLVPPGSPLDPDALAQFDANITRHTERLNRKRPIQVRWKYFQYLALLFTEIYLDRWFRDADGLLRELNNYVASFNDMLVEMGEGKKDLVPEFTADGLRKLSFWSATGSGKTLLLNMHVMQFRDYLHRFRRTAEINRVVVLTPNEQLTRQHLEEFRLSSISAAPFDKNRTGDMMSVNDVDVIDMNKLREEGKRKTVSVDQFLTNNLVFIDEGHRGARGDVWYDMRSRLAKDGGFTFEYSATFGQVAGNDPGLAAEYARNILFDYSYRFFHGDGFGKDYSIVNISSDQKREIDTTSHRLYLTACLLTYYQQVRLFDDRRERYRPFRLEKPLWVFVGARVAGLESDVMDILRFLAHFLKEPKLSIECLNQLMTGDTGFHRKDGSDLFAEEFTYLYHLGIEGEELYKDILRRLFNTDASGLLHVELLKRADGEVALRAGNSDTPFGVINVGDARTVRTQCEAEKDLIKVEPDNELTASLFPEISAENSPINVLIGSKRFTEGWNSYRVSTLGLMKMGRREGSEIIQLFGRGVRLRGYGNSLKRSRVIPWIREDGELAKWVPHDHHLPLLETLHVFGVKADYMDSFRAFLEQESIRPDRKEQMVRIRVQAPSHTLWTIKIKASRDFKDCERPVLSPLDHEERGKRKVTLDWYPRVVMRGSRKDRKEAALALETGVLGQQHVAFLDHDAIFFALQRHKAEKGWHNLNLGREAIRELLTDPSWYTLYIPEERLRPRDFARVAEWQEIAIALLKKYCDLYYVYRKEQWETDYRCFAPLTPDDPNFPNEDQYYVYVDRSETLFLHHLKELSQRIEDGVLQDFRMAGGKGEAIFFDRHLYSPLLYLKKGIQSDLIRVSPIHLNEGERQFVIDLRAFHDSRPSLLADCDIYLLRNQTRGKGIGFFEAGNFYPDFILWIQRGDVQHIVFVDPKGIYRCTGIEDPKLRFGRDIKGVEARMLESFPEMKGRVTMDSFIISNTGFGSVRWWRPDLENEVDFEAFHVLFQNSSDANYVGRMFERVLTKRP